MSWPQYLAYTQSRKADIGLAPLLPSRFNAARGATKWMDYARMGAVGIYTDVQPYSEHVRHGVNGLLLPNEPEVWVQNILDLADNTELREQMRIAANGSFRYVA
jgi:glycosyltransferase involved in cell wall biosynthesis